MTPKEKAEELVDKFILNVLDYDGSGLNGFKAKQCALICVEQILKRNQPVQGHFWSYWEQVKQEIEKI